MENAKVKIELVNGCEGESIYIDDYRVAGPKPWGDGRTEKMWMVNKDDILQALSRFSQCYKSEDKDEYWGYWIKCACGFDLNVESAKFCSGCGKKINVLDTMDFYPKF